MEALEGFGDQRRGAGFGVCRAAKAFGRCLGDLDPPRQMCPIEEQRCCETAASETVSTKFKPPAYQTLLPNKGRKLPKRPTVHKTPTFGTAPPCVKPTY
jgi:hypothetical protein